MAEEAVHAAHPAAAPGERGGAPASTPGRGWGCCRPGFEGVTAGVRCGVAGWPPGGGLMKPPLGPADHAGAALPELPLGAVPLHQGPGDAEEPVPDHGQWLCEWGGPRAGLTTPNRATRGAETERRRRGGSPRTSPGEACSAVCVDITCPDPGSQMGKLRLRGCARTCWASGSCSLSGLTPASRPFPGSGSVFLQPALLAPGLICCASQLVPLLCRPQSLPLGSKGVGLLKPQLSLSAFGCLLYWVRLS